MSFFSRLICLIAHAFCPSYIQQFVRPPPSPDTILFFSDIVIMSSENDGTDVESDQSDFDNPVVHEEIISSPQINASRQEFEKVCVYHCCLESTR